MALHRMVALAAVALAALACSEQPKAGSGTGGSGGNGASGGSAGNGGSSASAGAAGATGGTGGWPTSYEPPTEATVLDTLRAGHPRLIVLDSDLERIQASIEADPVALGYRDALLSSADDILIEPVSERVVVGPRLLAVSRTVLRRIYTLALAYRLSADASYLDRARSELLAVAGFSDWNPSHFLDVAEMTHAFAIGYDWLYADLSDADRAVVKQAIVDKGLLPARAAYEQGAWWTDNAFNWNNVCNGGIAIGALAVADEEPELAAWLLVRNITNLPAALASYAPDGAWAEGPGYWGYATRYTVAAFAALKSALGTEFGLSSFEGLADTGRFRVSMVGPSGLFFNFADASDRAGRAPELFWLGRRYDQPLYAYSERQYTGTRGSYTDLAWYDDRGSVDDLLAIDTDSWFHGADVVALRGSWTDPDTTYVGFKGGDNQANHSHLDLGTFVLDALGERWAIDLGPDDYNLPGYFGAERYTYYRLATEGQNTLVLNGANQDENAAAPVTAFERSAAGAFGVTDLTRAYAASGATRVERGIALLDGRQRVLMRDELEAAGAVDVVWTMHTMADVVVRGSEADLTQNGQTLLVRVLAPVDAVLSVSDVALAAPQEPSDGVRKLQLTPSGTTSATELVVLFVPSGAPTTDVTSRPLAEWQTSGPIQ